MSYADPQRSRRLVARRDRRLSPRRRGGGKVESVLCFPSGASFPPSSPCRWLQRLISIVPAAGHHGPGDACQFVDNHFVAGTSPTQAVHNCPNPQIDIARFGDAVESLFSTSRVLSWHHPDPAREIAPWAKPRCHQCSGLKAE